MRERCGVRNGRKSKVRLLLNPYCSGEVPDDIALREMVLTDLGWRIRRIWSTEWWMDAATALDKVHSRLEEDLAADRASRALSPTETPLETETPDPEPTIEPTTSDAAEPEAAETPLPVVMPEPVTLPPAPEALREDEEGPARVYARGPAAADLQDSYEMIDPASVARPERDRFYDVSYRPQLRQMLDHIVDLEGPIFFDLLVDRLARAHGLHRSGETVRQVVGAALGTTRYITTRENNREVVWPRKEGIGRTTAFRGAGGREHVDIPLQELAGLADLLRDRGLRREELVRGMQEHFGLARLAAPTRARFEAAIEN